jgi:putative ABC transport system substrate-binding protein
MIFWEIRRVTLTVVFTLTLVGAVLAAYAQPAGGESPLPPVKPVTDLKSVAGPWDATAVSATAPSGSFVWTIREDGSCEMTPPGFTGTVRVSEGKLIYRNSTTGGTGSLTLHEGGGQRVMRGASDNGVYAFELRPRKTTAAEPARGQPTNVRRIGVLALASSATGQRGGEALWQGLGELGWIAGQNLVTEFRSAEGKPDRLAELAAELIRLKVELIIATCGPQIPAILKASSTIPIVSVCPDLVGAGMVASLARPGGNITGVAMLGRELIGKRLELLKAGVPKASRVTSLWYPVYDRTIFRQEMEHGARAMNVKLLPFFDVRGPDDFEAAFAAMVKGRADALMVPADPFTLTHRQRIVELAAKSRLPTMFDLREFVDAGGLMSYGPRLPDLFRRVAAFVDKILKGAKPGDLPVEQPTTFELVINRKTAKALGLTIPPALLMRADQVIE